MCRIEVPMNGVVGTHYEKLIIVRDHGGNGSRNSRLDGRIDANHRSEEKQISSCTASNSGFFRHAPSSHSIINDNQSFHLVHSGNDLKHVARKTKTN